MANATRTTRRVEKVSYVDEEVITVEMTVATAAIVRALIGPVPQYINGADLYPLYAAISDVLDESEKVELGRFSEARKVMRRLAQSLA